MKTQSIHTTELTLFAALVGCLNLMGAVQYTACGPEEAVTECLPMVFPANDSTRYVVLTSGDQTFRRVPVAIVCQPYVCTSGESKPNESRDIPFRVYRIRSTDPEWRFTFSLCSPDPEYKDERRFQTPGTRGMRVLKHPGYYSAIRYVRLLINGSGETFFAWHDGRSHLYIQQIAAPNNEDEVVSPFLECLHRMDRAFTEYAEGVGQAVVSGTDEPQVPEDFASHEGTGLPYGLPTVTAVIDLKKLLFTKELFRDCQMPVGYAVVRVWDVAPYAPTAQWMRWVSLRIVFQGTETRS